MEEGGFKEEAARLQRRARLHIRNLSQFRVPAAPALKRAELSISLVTDPKIRKLNKQWRSKDKATDVLSFPQFSPEELKKEARGKNPLLLGDIVISVPTARRQAKERGLSLAQELEVLLVHGLLHLLGYDHELSDHDAARMRRIELKLLGRSMIG